MGVLLQDLLFFQRLTIGFLVSAGFIFIILLFLPAGYGRFIKKQWGPKIPQRWAWFLMEFPTVFLYLAIWLTSSRRMDIVPLVFSAFWMVHYVHRTFVYPLRIRRSEPFALVVALSGTTFQLINVYMQAAWIFYFAPEDMYVTEWLSSVPFILGVVVFVLGQVINKQSDAILRALRSTSAQIIEYKVPYGGMFRYISCPNYLGEIMTWMGWWLMLFAPVAFVFFFWVFANLFPRALAYHRWYLARFPDYPKNRKAILPFIV